MRINWNKVPYYLITLKPVFGNLGKIMEKKRRSNQMIYLLRSLVNKDMRHYFYESELISVEDKNAL